MQTSYHLHLMIYLGYLVQLFMHKTKNNLIVKHKSSFKIQHLEGSIVLRRIEEEPFKLLIQILI